MNTPLNNDTQQKARELARQITVAHDLDPEIQEELYGHIEDKLLAYKSGDERVTDEDAFILVREHFGDARVIRGLLQEVHAGAVTLTLGRLIGAACITSLTVDWLCRLLALPMQGIARAFVIDGDFSSQTGAIAFLLYNAPLPLYPLGVAVAFLYWRNRVVRGNPQWFQRWRVRDFFRTSAFLIVAILLTPALEQLPFHAISDGLALLEPTAIHTELATWVLLCWLCVAWLWWCDVSLRRLGGVVCCLGSWVTMVILTSHLPLQLVQLAASDPSDIMNQSGQFALFGLSYTWTDTHISWSAIIENLSWTLRITPLAGMSALLLYVLGPYLQVLVKANAEYPRPLSGIQILGQCFIYTMMLLALFRDQPWTASVTSTLLITFVSLGLYAVINLIYVARASANRTPYLARALRHASNGILCLVLFFSLYHHDSNSTSDGILRVAFLTGMLVAMAWIVVASLMNWWKHFTPNQGREGIAVK